MTDSTSDYKYDANFDYDRELCYQLAIDEAIITGRVSLKSLLEKFSITHELAEGILKKMQEKKVVDPSGDSEGLVFVVRKVELYDEVCQWVMTRSKVGIIDIQREFKLAWSHAKRLLYALEREGVVSGGEMDERRVVIMSVPTN